MKKFTLNIDIKNVDVITNLVNERQSIWDKYQESYDDKLGNYTIKEPAEIDQLGDKILSLLKEHFDVLPLEFIVDVLTHLGYAPCMIYDDNGNFSYQFGGFCSTRIKDDQDFDYACCIEAGEFRDNQRDALRMFFETEE